MPQPVTTVLLFGGTAVSRTGSLRLNVAMQEPGQLMPAGQKIRGAKPGDDRCRQSNKLRPLQ